MTPHPLILPKMNNCLLSLSFLCLAFYIPYLKNEADLNRILIGLLTEEEFPTRGQQKKVAIGIGSCVDIFTNGVELFDYMGVSPPEKSVHNEVIDTEEELTATFAFFFERGSASERYVSNETLFRHWIDVAMEMSNSRIETGGNAPVIANRFALEGWNVLLGAKMKASTQKHLHRLIQVSEEALDSDRNDYHLLMEFDTNDEWGRYVSPRANRFIIHNDYSNMMLEALDSFVVSLRKFNPSLVIIGGLQMLDNFHFDRNIRTEKLKRISRVLASLPSATKIHFEMASFTEERLFSELVEYIIPYVDSLGMNEQELADLCSFYEHGNLSVASNPFPRVAFTLDQIRRLYSYLGNVTDSSQGKRPQTRIHVHTLAYQAIYITKHSDWQNTNSAVAKASLTAYRHVCASKNINIETAKVIMDDSFTVSLKPGSHRMPLVDSAPVSCWGEENGRICVAPNLVCTVVHQTGGGGDNISAAGLVLQI